MDLWQKINEGVLFFIGGPCVIENEQDCFFIAKELKLITERLGIPFVFKASYDKANRTSVSSFRGPGIDKGLKVLARIKSQLDVPVTSDAHNVKEIDKAGEVLDIIQIPAFLCRQTDLLIEAGKTGKIVNIKKGQFMAPWDMKNVIDKIKAAGNKNILLTERGVSFGYNNLVNDMRSIMIMKSLGVPVVFDATHSVQLPGAGDDCSLGQSEFVPGLALSACAVGVNGLFFEVHHKPKDALCDGGNMVCLDEIEGILKKAIGIKEIICRH